MFIEILIVPDETCKAAFRVLITFKGEKGVIIKMKRPFAREFIC